MRAKKKPRRPRWVPKKKVPCPVCRGTRRISTGKCPTCRRGWVKKA